MEKSVAKLEKEWNENIRLYPHDRLVGRWFLSLVPRSVTPNHITVVRMLLTPVVLWFLWAESYDIGVPLFIFVASTDMFDGTLARTRRQITRWGTLYDPLADKLLIGSVLFVVVLRDVNYHLGWAILALELMILGGAWLKRHTHEVRPANVWGKAKMVAEVVGVTLLLVARWLDISLLVNLSIGTLALALVVALVSLLPRASTT